MPYVVKTKTDLLPSLSSPLPVSRRRKTLSPQLLLCCLALIFILGDRCERILNVSVVSAFVIVHVPDTSTVAAVVLHGSDRFHQTISGCPCGTTNTATSSRSQSGLRLRNYATTSGTTLFMAKRSKKNNDDEDDVVEPDVSDLDWRAFRAKLVMGEVGGSNKRSEQQQQQQPAEAEGQSKSSKTKVDDWDGIGTIFSEEDAIVSSSSSSTSATENQKSLASLLPKKGMTPLDPSQWAYESGTVIEQGAVILGGVEQDYGFGLRQQYFHKAAILVLDHEESTFTKGIILNRPTNVLLEDDINPGVQWRVWFGGDVQGLESNQPDIVCLHSLKDPKVAEASIAVMKDIQWTTFENAKRLVQAGLAKSTDFWVFCGYAGWAAGQLRGELDRKSWYMVATDSQTLLQELARLGAGADPREAGLDTWTLLMTMIGRYDTAQEHSGGFDDLMLKEWARQHLWSEEGGAVSAALPMKRRTPPPGVESTQDLLRTDPVDRFLRRVTEWQRGDAVITAGSLVRASSADRSPFLLNQQELHKSLVLILSDDEHTSVGVVLNRPASKGLDINIKPRVSNNPLNTPSSSNTLTITLPLRFGGQYAVKGSEPLLWLHCNPKLRKAQIGSPVAGIGTGSEIYKCTAADVTTALTRGLATPREFLVVSGVTVWTKGEKGLSRGIQGEVKLGKFEVVPSSKTQAVWDILTQQAVLTKDNLLQSVEMANKVWEVAASDDVAAAAKPVSQKSTNASKSQEPPPKKNGVSEILPLQGIGEGYDEEDDTYVFNSDVKVAKLSDDALRSWLATFLLGAPELGAS